MTSKKSPNGQAEIRKHYFLDKYVIITPGRAKRPRDIKEQTILKRIKACPFCPENIDKKTIVDKSRTLQQDLMPNSKVRDKIDEADNWGILSVKNIFPAVTLDNKKAFGAQEVIIETPDHSKELADLNESQVLKLLDMYVKRTEELARNKKLDYILCFKNQGSKAGASIVHAHSQVFATQMLPPDIKEELSAARAYKKKNKTCPYCDIIKKEAKSKRKIYEDKSMIAFTPYASEYHYEVWIFPKRHLDNITLLSAEELKSLAKVLKKALTKMQKLNLSFNYFLHNVISDKGQHFYIKIQPRDSIWAGVELGSGLVINSVSPEVAAEYYRKK